MNNEKTGRFIADLRKEKSLTQAQLAELIHVSDKAVSRWETGRGFPDLDNMEALSECLEVTVPELLKGERLSDSLTREDMQDITRDSFSISKEFFKRKKYVSILLGFLIGLLIISAAAVHLNSPIYVSGAGDAITVEELPDGKVMAVLGDKVSGYDIEKVTDPDTGSPLLFISCYRTRWESIRGISQSTMVMLGDRKDLGKVYYYPSPDGDELIYSGEKAGNDSGGVQTLPRLIYNGWLIIGIAASLVGLIIYFIFRKKYFAETVLKIALIPIALTLSIPLCLMGRFGEVYNAAFYLSGIVLLAAVIYVIFILLLRLRKAR